MRAYHFLKRILYIALVVFTFSVIITACGGSGSSHKGNSSSSQNSEGSTVSSEASNSSSGAPQAVRTSDIEFQYGGEGETKTIVDWGIVLASGFYNNEYVNLSYLIQSAGAENINTIFTPFNLAKPLTETGELDPEVQSVHLAQLAYTEELPLAKWALIPPQDNPYERDSYFYNADGISLHTDRWVAAIKATQNWFASNGKELAYILPFDAVYYYEETKTIDGTPEELKSILSKLAHDSDLNSVGLMAPGTRNNDDAIWWYDQVADVASLGSIVQRGGSADSLVNFWQHVIANGDLPYDPHVINLAEVIYGANYGLYGAASSYYSYSRGLFVKASKGKRLGYAESRPDSTAAAVYRSPAGMTYGFAGSLTDAQTNYRFISTDQPVYFNGIGPIWEYVVPTRPIYEPSFTIEQTPSLPALDGHYWKLINAATGEVLTLASTHDGDSINIITGENSLDDLNQVWRIGNDYQQTYSLINGPADMPADIDGYDPDNPNIKAWEITFDNYDWDWDVWQIEPTGDGYAYLIYNYKNQYLEVDTSTHDVRIASFSGESNQKWMLELADEIFGPNALIAHYAFDNNTDDNTGGDPAIAFGGPAFTAGKVGQAISLDGQDDYLNLVFDIGNIEDFTIATWVYWAGGAANQRIFEVNKEIGVNRPYLYLTPSNSDGLMYFAFSGSLYSTEQALITNALPQNQWVHIALTLRGNTAMLYINGTLKVAGFISYNPTYFRDLPYSNYLGKSKDVDNPFFAGAIDDFRVYNFGLSAAQVEALANP